MSDSRMSANQVKNTNSANGATFVAFTGSSIDWVATKAPWYGIARMTVDGSTVTTASLYNKTFAYQQTVWSSGPLTSGAHTLKIEWTNSCEASSTGNNVNIDAFDVVGVLTPMRDTAAPVTTTNAQATYDQSATITLSATDAMSTVSYTKYALDASGWVTGTVMSTSVAATHTLSYYSVDTQGNTEAVKTITFKVTTPYTRYEQTEPLLSYTGTWQSISNSQMSAGTLKNTNTATGSVTAAFTGTKVRWITTTSPNYGIGKVYVDGVPVALVDLWSTSFAYQQVVWSSPLLSSGSHTLKIEWTSTKRAGSNGTNVGVDAIEVIGSLTPVP
jgi:hypothetical protein